jgi:hypothetical protein
MWVLGVTKYGLLSRRLQRGRTRARRMPDELITVLFALRNRTTDNAWRENLNFVSDWLYDVA